MKRSQMELLIAECLVEPHFDDVFEEAKYILKKLEKAGMLPPRTEVSEFIYDPEGNPLEEAHGYNHVWEPEDE